VKRGIDKCWPVLAAATLVLAGPADSAAAQVVTEFRVAASGPPLNIAPGPGGMWFTEENANRIGVITSDGHFSEFPVNRPAWDIVAGPDGNLWFTSNGFLSRMTRTGVVTDFPLIGNAWGVTVGPDRNIWFTEIEHFPGSSGNGVLYGYLGHTTAAGPITELKIEPWAESLTPGPDGNYWLPDWTEIGYDAIVRVTASGAATRFVLPGGLNAPGDVGPASVAVGSDGNIWFTQARVPQIGRITLSGEIAEFEVGGNPRGIAAGSDGALWFTEPAVNKVGRLTTSGGYLEFAIPTADSQPWGISAGPEGDIWFTERGAMQIGRVVPAVRRPEPIPSPSRHTHTVESRD
jgi:streptogramin lyase